MGDREPRRRKKRKDSAKKVQFTEDHHVEPTPTMLSHKSEYMDSDQDLEEDIIAPPPSHQPSKLAQLVFMLIFLALAGLLGSLFIALHGSKSQIELYGGVEEEHAEPLHLELDHGEHVAEDSEHHEDEEHLDDHEEEGEEELIDIFPNIMKHFQMFEPDTKDAAVSEEKVSQEPPLIIKDDLVYDDSIVNIEENNEDNTIDNISDNAKEVIDESPIVVEEKLELAADNIKLPVQETVLNIETNPIPPSNEEKISLAVEETSPKLVLEESSINDIKEEIVLKVDEKLPIIEEMSPLIKEELSPPILELKPSLTPEEITPSVVLEKPPIAKEKKPVEENVPAIENPESSILKEHIPSNAETDSGIEDDEDGDEDNESDLPPVLGDIPPVLEHPHSPIGEKEKYEKEFSENLYEKADITNEEDYFIRNDLDDIEKILDKFPRRALKKYEDLLKTHSASPRALYGHARAFDILAEVERSNKMLEDAILSYQKVLSVENVPEKLYLEAGNRCAERMQFRGFIGKSIKVLHQMATRFPKNIDIKNRIAVSYLLIGRNKEAKQAFMETLKEAPDNGFAKVHLGFILKTDESDYENAIKYMSEGIQSREKGVIDGRFYLHLGDALARTGRETEAMKVYDEGVNEGLFMSVYQRSLYNVNGLTAKPWWDPFSMTYAPYFKILEKNWIAIRDEALSIITKKSGFAEEREGLQDTGDWKQFDLYARGAKVSKNCALTPYTCSLITQIPAASKCKRGQVKFSIMKPGTHVWAHNGPTNCRLRAHLGLVVPSGTKIRVANETRTWEEGKVLLFDDSFEHEVWHNGTSDRLVLIVDFWHPELTDRQRATLSPI